MLPFISHLSVTYILTSQPRRLLVESEIFVRQFSVKFVNAKHSNIYSEKTLLMMGGCVDGWLFKGCSMTAMMHVSIQTYDD